MRIKKIVPALSIGLLIIPSNVFALRCGSRLVDIGDRKIEVVQKCGEPTLIEKWGIETTKLIKRRGKKYSKDIFTDQEVKIKTEYVEEWTYNFGANRLIHFLTITNGKLTSIEIGSRGFDGDFPSNFDKNRCGNLVEEGDRKIDVLMRCGQPIFEETRIEEKITSRTNRKKIGNERRYLDINKGEFFVDQSFTIDKSTKHQEKKVLVNVTDWSFNFGPNYFLQFITFENGVVKKIEQGDYGYE